MIEIIQAILPIMLVLFTCIVIGYVLRKFKILPEDTDKVLSRLETYVFCPALSFSAFSKYCTIEALKDNYSLLIYSIIGLAVSMGIAIPLSMAFAKKEEYKNKVYQYALAFGNYGYIGNVVVMACAPSLFNLSAEEALFKFQLFTLPLAFLIYLWGLTILTPKEKRKGSPLKNLINVPIIAIFVGILVGLTGLNNYMPKFIETTVSNLSNCMGPVAMLLTGFVLGGYSLKKIIKNGKVLIASLLRLIVLPIILVGILWLFKADKFTLNLVLFAYAVPLGLNTVVFPAAMGGETETGASMALISSVLSIITLPIIYALVNIII